MLQTQALDVTHIKNISDNVVTFNNKLFMAIKVAPRVVKIFLSQDNFYP